MAGEKLAQGVELFGRDAAALEALLRAVVTKKFGVEEGSSAAA